MLKDRDKKSLFLSCFFRIVSRDFIFFLFVFLLGSLRKLFYGFSKRTGSLYLTSVPRRRYNKDIRKKRGESFMGKRLEKAETLFWGFLLASVIGWGYEVFLEVVVYRWGYSDRGVLSGPYCPVYGTGALIVFFCLNGLRKKRIPNKRISVTPLLVFVGIVLITSAVELAASYIMEWTVGSWMWDYSNFHPNFQGRISLNTGLRFGVGGMLFLYLLYPAIERLTARTPSRVRHGISAVLAAVFLADCAFYLAGLL